jgi:hypothetical protein
MRSEAMQLLLGSAILEPGTFTREQLGDMRHEMERWHMALVRLSTEVFFSARDVTGEGATRRVQDVARRALQGLP